MPFIAWIFEALESWGISKLVGWIASRFRRTPEKDMKESHDVEIDTNRLSDAAVDDRLRNKWSRD